MREQDRIFKAEIREQDEKFNKKMDEFRNDLQADQWYHNRAVYFYGHISWAYSFQYRMMRIFFWCSGKSTALPVNT